MSPEFRPRFPLSEVPFWADRYAYADDSAVRSKGEQAGLRGWYTREDFLAVMLWKTARTQSRCSKNTEASVVKATRLALSTRDERERMCALTALHGVTGVPDGIGPAPLRPPGPVSDHRLPGALEPERRRAARLPLLRVLVDVSPNLGREGGVPVAREGSGRAHVSRDSGTSSWADP